MPTYTFSKKIADVNVNEITPKDTKMKESSGQINDSYLISFEPIISSTAKIYSSTPIDYQTTE